MAWWLFQNVIITSALVATVAMLSRVWRIGPVARHALWVLVLLKFVTPPVIEWPWAVPDPLGIATTDTRAVDDVAPMAIVSDLQTPGEGVASEDWSGTPTALGSPTSRALDLSVVWTWLPLIWLTGSVGLLLLEGLRLLRLSRKMRHARAADPAIVSRVEALALQLGIRPIPVVMLADAGAPAVWGVGRPRLLWPANLPADSTDACIDGLIVHELAHVKRGDHLVGWLELIAGTVWWWNPLFWYARSAMREQAELACDAWVISALPHGRRAYAESLLTLSGATFGGASTAMAVVGAGATSRRMLERRLVMIMKGRTSLRLPFVGLCCLALVAAAALPTWAASQDPPTPPVPPPPPTPIIREIPAPPPPVPVQPVAPPPAPAPPQDPTRARIAVREIPPQVPAGERRGVVGGVRAVPPSRVLVARDGRTTLLIPANLPDDGKALVEGYKTDIEAIQAEAERKTTASREAIIKSLQDLQEKYTREGKLDEAIAIRDYLRAGGPGGNRGGAFGAVRRQR